MPPDTDAQLPVERQWIEQLVDERIQAQLKTFAEGVGQGIAEMRALLRNEIAAAEGRAAWGAENRDEKLEAAMLDLLLGIEHRLAGLEQRVTFLPIEQRPALPIEHRVAALERLALPPQKPRLIAGRSADDAA
jgi:hypothetical protein